MFKENIINLPFWTIIKMPIYKEYLNHTLGLTLSTPGLVINYCQALAPSLHTRHYHAAAEVEVEFIVYYSS